MHAALCDNMNTVGAMNALLAVASDAFAYLKANAAPDALLLMQVQHERRAVTIWKPI